MKPRIIFLIFSPGEMFDHSQYPVYRIFRISYLDRITNEEVLRRANSNRTLLNLIRSRKLRYCGHLIRANNLQRHLLDGKCEGKRRQGKQRSNWMTDVKKWTSLNYEQCIRKAANRDAWRSMVAHVCNGHGTID